MRKICVFTGTRAEYGLLKPLMYEIKCSSTMHLQLVASCMHLSPEFGLTYKEIENDGFTIDEKIEILLSSDTPAGIVKSIGLGFIGFADVLNRLKPDLAVVLGDRFEALAFACSCYIYNIPVVHLYGGEATWGVIDEGIRHAITKMSYLHFTSTEEYRKRVIQLGESPHRVFNVGALGLDNIRKLKLLTKKSLERRLGIKFKRKNLLVTYHPVTLEEAKTQQELKSLLKVLASLKDTFIIITKPNADPQGWKIIKAIDEFVKNNKSKSKVFTSMGQLLYLSTLKYVDAVVGNSSSGIIEAPSFKIGTINIGDRQKGRIRAESVIDCKGSEQSIKKALEKLYSCRFQKQLKKVKNPYGDGHATERIISIIKKIKIIDLKKKFYDLMFEI